jgi:hypothetical protein
MKNRWILPLILVVIGGLVIMNSQPLAQSCDLEPWFFRILGSLMALPWIHFCIFEGSKNGPPSEKT